MTEGVTHDHLELRLQETKESLIKDIRDTEKLLRAEFIASVSAAEGRLTSHLRDLDKHLDKQDSRLWKFLFIIVSALVGLAAYLIEHAVIH